MRIFGSLLKLCFVCATFAACGAGVIFDAPGHATPEGTAVTARGGEPGTQWRLVDWRGHEVEGAAGTFDERGEATLPPLPAGYYRMVDARSTPPDGSAAPPLSEGGNDTGNSPLREGGGPEGAGGSTPSIATNRTLATLAVVPPPLSREATLTPQIGDLSGEAALNGCEGASSAFAADTASTWISRPGAFLCPWNGGDTERTVADLVRLCGFRHVRDRLKWQSAQPSPDAPPDFSCNLNTAALFHERGAAVSGMFHDAPRWTRPAPKLPGDLGALHHFCAEAAAAFGEGVEDWEFWNEPDIHFAPEPVWEYAAAMKAAYLGFKSVRPDLPILNGALCQMPGKSRYFDILFDNDAVHYFDIYNYHTYLPPAKYPEAFATIRERLAEVGATNCPVWVTEFGTNLEGNSDREGAKKGLMAHSPEQELVHAEFYPKAQIALMMEGVERAYFFVFAAFNERNGRKDWGVIRRDGTVKPVFSSMATMNGLLGEKSLLGRLDTPHGVRAYLFGNGQESTEQTLVFWAESPLDKATSNAVIKPTPDYATPFTIISPLREGGGGEGDGGSTAEPLPMRLIDMCGMVTNVVPSADGTNTITATRFPAYLTGLHGLKADTPPHSRGATLSPGATLGPEGALRPRSGHLGDVDADGIDISIVIRVDLNRKDFSIGSQKTLASLDADEGRLRVEVWNFSDAAKTGTVSATDCPLSGLPPEPFALPPFGHTVFDCILKPGGGPSSEPSAEMKLRGRFNGRATTHAVVPVFFAKHFHESCTSWTPAWKNPANWARNTSAQEFSATWDETEKAVRFDVAWNDPETDRWFYPVLALNLPIESLVGARRIAFDVKSIQDKVENDFRTQNLMLVRGNGDDTYLQFEAPTTTWERRYVDLLPGENLANVTAIRIGANPLGSRCTFWVRNVEVLK